MRIDPDSIVSFSYGKEKKELYNQAQFFVGYYTAKLRLLRAENDDLYITKQQSAQEMFFKDMISSSMIFLNNLKDEPLIENYEKTIGTSSILPQEVSTTGLTDTVSSRREHLPSSTQVNGRREHGIS